VLTFSTILLGNFVLTFHMFCISSALVGRRITPNAHAYPREIPALPGGYRTGEDILQQRKIYSHTRNRFVEGGRLIFWPWV